MKRLANFVGFGLALGSLWYFDANPRVVVYLFVLSVLARLVTVQVFFLVHQRYARGWPGRLVRWLASPAGLAPDKDRASYPSYPFGKFIWDMGWLSWLSFVFLHQDVGPTNVAWSAVRPELVFALELTLLYWITDFVAGNVKMDFTLTCGQNVGLHAGGVRILLLSMIVCTIGIMALKYTGLSPSSWLFCGALLAVKCVYDSGERQGGPVAASEAVP